MKQDPITLRFIEVFHRLKEESRVRSARQFALSLDTYAQSFNDILKGRREATLQMVQRLTKVYHVSAHYLLTGEGSMVQASVNGISTCPKVKMTFLQAHEFGAYASAISAQKSQKHDWSTWDVPGSLVGQQIKLAIQCDTDRLSSCIAKGDILFARKVPKEAWKSSLSSTRVYAITLKHNFYLIRITGNDVQGIMIQQDDRGLPAYISYADIHEIWCPISKWSNNVLSNHNGHLHNNSLEDITSVLRAQTETINSLQSTVQRLTKQEALQY